MMMYEPLRHQLSAELHRRIAAGLRLGGYTWHLRDKIKQAGGIWDAAGSCWLMPNEQSIKQFTNIKTPEMWMIPKKEQDDS